MLARRLHGHTRSETSRKVVPLNAGLALLAISGILQRYGPASFRGGAGHADAKLATEPAPLLRFRDELPTGKVVDCIRASF
jgi:hypothetical protein